MTGGQVKRADVVAFVRENGPTTSAQVAAEFGIDVHHAHAHLARAHNDGTLARDARLMPHIYSVTTKAARGPSPYSRLAMTERIAEIDRMVADLTAERGMLVRAVSGT